MSFHKHGMQGKSLVTQQVRETSSLQTYRVHDEYWDGLVLSSSTCIKIGVELSLYVDKLELRAVLIMDQIL